MRNPDRCGSSGLADSFGFRLRGRSFPICIAARRRSKTPSGSKAAHPLGAERQAVVQVRRPRAGRRQLRSSHRTPPSSEHLGSRRLGSLARAVQAFSKFLTHIDISPRAEIGPGLYFYHGLGTVIGKGTRVGRNALICQNVTLGGGQTIGDDVRLWAGAKVIGRVTIGDRAEIGANGVVVAHVPPDTIAVGVPATRHLPKQSSGAPDLDD